jgi:hypothetical protein
VGKIEDRIARIKTEKIGATTRRVLLLEGTDDVTAMQILLSRKFPAWERTWLLEQAGNKKQVLEFLAQEPTWLGLVDRDEWTDVERDQAISTHTGLHVLPRFCMESYLINPAELWAALPEKQRSALTQGHPQLEEKILADKPAWLRHAALWHTINPLWRQLYEKGFPRGVLNIQAIPDDTLLLEKLNDWHATIDASVTLTNVQNLQTRLQPMSNDELLANWLYAKDFFPQVVHLVLNQLLGQQSLPKRRIDLFKKIPIPVDLDPLWEKMGLP